MYYRTKSIFRNAKHSLLESNKDRKYIYKRYRHNPMTFNKIKPYRAEAHKKSCHITLYDNSALT